MAKPVRMTRSSWAYIIYAQNRNKANPAYAVINKRFTRRILEAMKVPLPRAHRYLGPLANVTPQLLSEPVVLKPVEGSTSRGVCLLEPDANGQWDDLLTGSRWSFDDITAHLAAVLEKRGFADDWLVEELLRRPGGLPGPVNDVKVYAFRGSAPLILLRGSNPKRFRWYGPDWQPVDTGKYQAMVGEDLEPPADGDRFLRLARDISAEMPIPFMRIDMYDTDRGPVVGELTPLPGDSDRFNDEWDQRLGELYEHAEATLLGEGMDWWGLVSSRPVRRVAKTAPARSRPG